MNTALVRPARPIQVTDALPSDNAALLALAESCPMLGDLSLCITREPDFFALTRLEGDQVRLGVARAGAGDIVGCIAVAARTAWVGGRPIASAYAGDFKVHPAWRGTGVADALTEYVRQAAREIGGDRIPIMFTVLAGNRAMEARVRSPRSGVSYACAGSIRAWSIPFLWPRHSTPPALRVDRAAAGDLDEMAERWLAVGPMRHFTRVVDRPAFSDWLNRAPGLRITDYLLARRRDGRIAGFLATWDQSSFKQLRVTGFAPRLALMRGAMNAVAPLLGTAPMPPEGQPLRSLTTVHLCVAPDEPEVLRALLRHAYRDHRRDGYAFMGVGLDPREPLNRALAGLLAQPTAVAIYLTSPAGAYAGPLLDPRPFHHEIALV
jgi:GNAT superfamily N-acetyltransferase